MKNRNRRLLLMVLATVLIGTIGLSPVVRAQSSSNFDLGCWGITLSGDQRQSPTFTIRDTVGEWAGGSATSPTVIVRSGHVQNWSTLYTVTPGPPPTPDAFQLYLPIIGKNIRVIRSCS